MISIPAIITDEISKYIHTQKKIQILGLGVFIEYHLTLDRDIPGYFIKLVPPIMIRVNFLSILECLPKIVCY